MRRGLMCAVAALVAVAVIAVGDSAPRARTARAAPAATTRYVAVEPARLADTRRAECGCTTGEAGVVRVQVAGRAGVPLDARAAALTITADRAIGSGYVSVWPAGTPRSETSVLNLERGAARANGAIVRLGAGGAIELVVSGHAGLIVDVTGAFVDATVATSGRFVTTEPARLLDTRDRAPLAPGEPVTVGRPVGISADATAVVANVTSVSPPASGYIGAHAAGAPRAETSILNVVAGEPARAATVIAPISPAGLTVWSSVGGHILVDVVGWFTGPSAPPDSVGLFVPLAPTRVLDTRASGPRAHPGGTVELGAPAGAAAVVTNVTATRTDAAGFLTAQPAGTPRVEVSALNPTGFDTTVANLAVTAASTRGLAYYSSSGLDLVVDLAGYFTGDPVAASLPPAPNEPPPPTVLLVGDSSLAGVRWYRQSTAALQGFVAILDAESCRRMSTPSCVGREDRVPPNAVEAILAQRRWLDTVVVQVGYNDWFDDFPAMLADVTQAARARGARRVLWLTYRDTGAASSPTARRAYAENNRALRAVAASGVHPDLVVADWNAYTASAAGWFVSDGVHFTLEGAYGAADYISRWIAHLHATPCPQPMSSGGQPAAPCPAPDQHTPPDVMALYGAQRTDVHCYEVGEQRALVCRRDTLLP